MTTYNLSTPLSEKDVTKLELGDLVYFSGYAFTCRSRLQKYCFDEGNNLPFSIDDMNLLIHVGPVIRKKDEEWDLISFMPTSSIRFEKWGPESIEEWGLKAIVGKTTMGEKTAQAMKRNNCVHCTVQSVSPNLWVDSIEIVDVHLRDQLGSIEAPWLFKLDKLGPFFVDMDSKGNNYFDELDKKIEKNRKKVYKNLNISENFEYTKLY